MKLFSKYICFMAVCFQAAINVRSEIRVSCYAGIASMKFRHKNTNVPRINIYDKLSGLRSILASQWDNSVKLIEGTDYTSISNAQDIADEKVCGFGKYDTTLGRWNFDSVTNKVNQYVTNIRSESMNIFSESEGFLMSEVRDTQFAGGYEKFNTDDSNYIVFNRISVPSIYLTNKNVPNFSARIIERSDKIAPDYFLGAGRPIEHAITVAISPVEADVIQAWNAATNPPTVKKNGLMLGLSGAYVKSFFPKASSTYGLYTGVEGFAEFNPSATKSNGFSIKEKSFGIRPFVGVIKKDSWAVYALGGVNCASRDIKSNAFHVNKCKLSYEIGVGSDYILSERFSVSAKFIKCLKSKLKINGLSFQTSSTKILFSLNYHF